MRISLDMHRPAEAVVGFLLIVFPFVLDMGAGAMVISVLLGAILVALAYGGYREGDSIPASTHLAMDRLVAAGLGLGALVALIGAHVAGTLVLALLAVVVIALSYYTRYDVGRPHDRTSHGPIRPTPG